MQYSKGEILIKNVTKRDGRQVPFDAEKITEAIMKAVKETRENYVTYIDMANSIATEISKTTTDLSVEQIQDKVVNLLLDRKMRDTAIAYIKYRYKRELARKGNTTDKEIMEMLACTSDYWSTENSNKNDKVVTTHRDYIAGIVSKDIAKRFIFPEEVVKAHEAGAIHSHDDDYIIQRISNCLHRYTRFITNKGIRSFENFKDGDKVTVVDKDGAWREATVHYFGVKEMQKVTFITSDKSRVKSVICTPDHRWILDDGTVTTNLSVGNVLCRAPLATVNWTVYSIVPAEDSEAWCVEEPVTHSFTLEQNVVTGNCSLLNLDDMLENGTVVNGVRIDPQNRLLTATTVATQIIAAVASSQFGGCTITLTHLAPYVRKSYERYLDEARKTFMDAGMRSVEHWAVKEAKRRIRREVKDAVQTFNYQTNSMSTTNGQAPFLTVFIYLDENPEYKEEVAMLAEEFFHQRILGMKNECGVYVTPAFPKLIYCLDEDNITEGSEYWYLTKLAAKCTAKRMVPDYISAKKMRELKGDVYPCIK